MKQKYTEYFFFNFQKEIERIVSKSDKSLISTQIGKATNCKSNLRKRNISSEVVQVKGSHAQILRDQLVIEPKEGPCDLGERDTQGAF